MIINLNDDAFHSFLHEILENPVLKAKFVESPYWKKGGEQAIQLVCNSHFITYPEEIINAIQLLISDVCPEQCEAGCNLTWDQMAATLINGDGLCEYHHHLKEKLDKE